eukprot:11197238-Ditylum_brightwellii.AAC.1
MQARLMGVDEDYHDDIEHENTHPTLLSQKAQECRISDETREVLRKAGAICTLLAATKTSLPDVQRKNAGCSGSTYTNKINGKRNSRVTISSHECVGRQGIC